MVTELIGVYSLWNAYLLMLVIPSSMQTCVILAMSALQGALPISHSGISPLPVMVRTPSVSVQAKSSATVSSRGGSAEMSAEISGASVSVRDSEAGSSPSSASSKTATASTSWVKVSSRETVSAAGSSVIDSISAARAPAGSICTSITTASSMEIARFQIFIPFPP